jgi:phytoene dehydrogenase-like protein
MAGERYEAIVVGGGHNGLVAAAYLAKAGLKTLVVERRNLLGGMAVTEEIYPGFRVDTVAHEAGMIRPQIVQELFLKMHDLELMPAGGGAGPAVFAPQPDGRALALWSNHALSAGSLGYFSQHDATNFAEYRQAVNRFAAFLERALSQTPPDLAQLDVNTMMSWLSLGREFKGMGGRDMYGLLRVLPMSLQEWMEEWFENDAVQALLAAPGITGIRQGPRAAGTVFVLLYHHLGQRLDGLPASAQVRGGVGNLSLALERAARSFGAVVRSGTAVKRILLDNGRATGVVLDDGEHVEAGVVLSGANPRYTFTELVDPYELDTHFVRAIGNIKFRGAVAKVNLALSGLPNFTAASDDPNYLRGRIQISPSMDYLEQAYDAAKYGRYSERPYLDIRIPSLNDSSLAPEGQHVMSIWAQYAPYQLRGTTWAEEGDKLANNVLNTLAEYAPNIWDLIVQRQILTPADLETTYGLAEGNIYHGDMMLDQLFFMRPVAGWAQYRTPISGLYLCGAGAHPGGGITGEPGRLAAQSVLQDRKAANKATNSKWQVKTR